MKSKLMLLLVGLLIGSVAWAQTKRVTGKVLDEDGMPVIGATVVVEGTAVGIQTDMEGMFVLQNVPADAKRLRVSCVGMEPRVVVIKDGQTIVLKNNALLDEVMVVAFGTAKKSAFTGSATVVDASQLEKQTVSNVADALVGNVPGLQMRGSSGAPGAAEGSINIRGIASMYASTDPLIIVDGSPYTASLSNLNPSDIASLTVLKDAASAALYGARGAAGVILITTKKAEAGKTQVNVDMKWGANSRAVQQYKTIKDPARFYEAYYSQLFNKFYYGDGMSKAEANEEANLRMLKDVQYNVFGGYGGNLIGLDGKINPEATLGRTLTGADGTQYYLTADDWEDAAFSNALRQEYNVNVSGANAHGNYFASVGYLNEDGVIDYSSYERITARLKADYQIKKWLRVGANVNFIHSDQLSTPNLSGGDLGATNPSYYTSNIAPIYPIYVRVLDENGNPTILKDEYGHDKYDYGVPGQNYPGIQRTFMATGNPLGANRYNETRSFGNQFNGTFNVDIKITDWLKLNATSNVIWGQNLVSWYENGYEGTKMSTNGALTKRSTYSLRTNNTQTLNFNKDFGKHNVTVLLGHEYYDQSTNLLEALAKGGFSDGIKEINAFADKYDASGYTTRYNVEGYFGSAQYNYAERYFASASYRRDASSRFAKENRWGDFWSVGAAWLINKEGFMQDVSWVDMLKVKASLGQQGNDNIGNWAYIDLYTLGPNSSNTGMSPSFYRKGNKDITWETTTNFNVGLEFALLGNRLNGSVEYYYKKTTDLLFRLSTPESAGYRGYYTNLGDIRNSGVEVTLDGHIIKNRLIDWQVGVNFTHNSNKVLKLPEAKTAQYGGFSESNSSSNFQYWYEEGKSMYTPFLPEYGIDEQGKIFFYQDKNNFDEENGTWNTSRPGHNRDAKTYNVNEATRYEQDCCLPKLFGGFNTSLSIGDFDLSATFDYQIGGKVYDYRYQGLMGASTAASGSTWHEDIFKSWTPDNTSSNIPRFQYGDNYTSATCNRWLTNASYLNFQSFTVGYTLPKFCKEISRLRVYVSGENICFWSARKGLDPRYAYDTNTYATVSAPIRTISGGIQVSF